MTETVLKIEASVESIRRFESGWCIASVLPIKPESKKSAESMIVVGSLPGVTEGMHISIKAKKTAHAKYGVQYKLIELISCGYSTLDGLKQYLSGEDFPDVGDVTASLIVNHFGESVIDILDADPQRVMEVPEANVNRLRKVAELWKTARHNQRESLELMKLGISTAFAHRILKHFESEDVMQILASNPYRLTEVRGIGFLKADEVALRCNIMPDSPKRIEAAILYVLFEYSLQGHCYMNTNRLIASVCELLGSESGQVGNCISRLRKEDKIFIDGASTYLAEMHNAEVEVSRNLTQALRYPHGKKHYDNTTDIQHDLSELEGFDNNIQLDGLQLQAIMSVLNERVCVITGGPGTGKAQPLESKVLTPNGWSKIGDLKKGDKVINPNGKIVKIKDIYPQGLKQTYTVALNDRTTTKCCLEHLWTIYRKRDRAEQKSPITVSTENLIFRLSKGDRMRRIYLPGVSGIEFEDNTKISGYVVGALLGDGTLSSNGIRFTNLDCDILSRIEDELPDDVFLIPIQNTQCCYGVSTGQRGNSKNKNSILQEFRKLELLGCNAYDKHIPREYLFSSSKTRLDILHGLMDTDGECGSKGTDCSFSSVSKQLCEDVCFLVQSLGGKATLCVKKGKYKGENHLSFRVTISLPKDVLPFSCTKKLGRYIPRTKYQPVRMIKSITKSEIEECVCISLDSDDGLYITDNFIPTHNTTITKAIVAMLEKHAYDYTLCSPTGRAAKRLAESSGKPAKTIHRLLGWDHVKQTFLHNSAMPLTTNFVLIDEFSMVDIRLFRDLLRALEPSTRIVMIGDKDQLPSVGAGNVLHDIIDSGVVPVVRLNKVFRQESGNTIVDVAHEIVSGIVSELPTPKESKGKNCMLVNIGDDSEKTRNFILQLINKEIPKLKDDNGNCYSSRDVQILTPRRTGRYSVEEMNPWMQEAVNPLLPGVEEIKDGYRNLRTGDRVMQLKNNYSKGDIGVFNGDIGYIVACSATAKGVNVKVKYPDIVTPVDYDDTDLDQIQHAWVSTVHKSQGSEIPIVIFVLEKCHSIMLQRNLLYTGVTRAKKLCLIMGEYAAFVTAVNNDKVINRNTGLASRLQEIAMEAYS